MLIIYDEFRYVITNNIDGYIDETYLLSFDIDILKHIIEQTCSGRFENLLIWKNQLNLINEKVLKLYRQFLAKNDLH